MNDPIERADAINEIVRWKGYIDEDMISRIQIGLKKLPSAQPEQRWIPVTQLPELDEDGYSKKLLLSFCNFPLPTIGEYRVLDGVGKWYDGDSDESVNAYALKVNAWMPLPEPYKGVEG